MIDLDAIEAEIDDAIGCADGQAPIQCSDAKEIIARLRQAEKDAARYRWLRENSTTGQSFGGFMIDVDCDGRPSNPFSGIDALIDEAMQCK